MVPSGIRFNDYYFTEPTSLADLKVPKYAGLFVILATDANWAPKPYQPLYFGEFGNNTPEAVLPGSHALPHCSGRDMTLLVSVLPMPVSTTAQRWALRDELLWAYNPAWQAKEIRSAAINLPNQLGMVDQRQCPQEAAQILQLFEPQPEREPRRRIGFVP